MRLATGGSQLTRWPHATSEALKSISANFPRMQKKNQKCSRPKKILGETQKWQKTGCSVSFECVGEKKVK